jgi:hypothetical protein
VLWITKRYQKDTTVTFEQHSQKRQQQDIRHDVNLFEYKRLHQSTRRITRSRNNLMDKEVGKQKTK